MSSFWTIAPIWRSLFQDRLILLDLLQVLGGVKINCLQLSSTPLQSNFTCQHITELSCNPIIFSLLQVQRCTSGKIRDPLVKFDNLMPLQEFLSCSTKFLDGLGLFISATAHPFSSGPASAPIVRTSWLVESCELIPTARPLPHLELDALWTMNDMRSWDFCYHDGVSLNSIVI